MNYIITLFVAIIMGQTFVAFLLASIFQKKNDKIGFWKAVEIYLKKEFGSFFVIISLTVLLIFILPDWLDIHTTRAELLNKGELTNWEKAQTKFRTIAVLYGVFAQSIAYIFYKGGRNAIRNYGKLKGFELTEEENKEFDKS